MSLTFDDDLSVHFVPPEDGRDGGFSVERVSLARKVVRGELETVVEPFEEHRSRRGTVASCRGAHVKPMPLRVWSSDSGEPFLSCTSSA